MSTFTDPITCPNCGVNEMTQLCASIFNRDEQGISRWIFCEVCGHYDMEARPEDYRQGEAITPEDVKIKARVLLLEQGLLDEEDINEMLEVEESA